MEHDDVSIINQVFSDYENHNGPESINESVKDVITIFENFLTDTELSFIVSEHHSPVIFVELANTYEGIHIMVNSALKAYCATTRFPSKNGIKYFILSFLCNYLVNSDSLSSMVGSSSSVSA